MIRAALSESTREPMGTCRPLPMCRRGGSLRGPDDVHDQASLVRETLEDHLHRACWRAGLTGAGARAETAVPRFSWNWRLPGWWPEILRHRPELPRVSR